MLLEVPLLAHIPDTSQSALEFVENKGQFHPLCRYKASIPYGNLYLENTGWCMVLLDTQEYHQNKQFRHDFPTLQNPHKVTGTALRFKLNGVDRKPRIKALHKLPHYYNYFYGRQRISKVHPNKECRYKEIEAGVDLEVSLNHSLKIPVGGTSTKSRKIRGFRVQHRGSQ
jgi:hypothetical protein